jgi:hypothetical protein
MPKIRKRREKPAKVLKDMKPGCAVLPEDSRLRVHNRSRLHAQPPRRPAPRVAPSKVRVPRSDVELRLMTAMKTLRAVPDKELRFFIVKSSSPDYIREYLDAYDPEDETQARFQPTYQITSQRWRGSVTWISRHGKSCGGDPSTFRSGSSESRSVEATRQRASGTKRPSLMPGLQQTPRIDENSPTNLLGNIGHIPVYHS